MIIKKASILLTLSIFGISTQVWSNPVKSINGAANRVTIMKMDENKAPSQKKTRSAKEPVKKAKEQKGGLGSDISYSDYGAMMGTTKSYVNFLKILEERRRLQLTDSLDNVIYSNEFSRNAWRNKLLSFQEVNETKPSTSDFGQSSLRSHPDENKYFEEWRILTTFKLIEFRREEIFKEIFMGFRFSFTPMRGHMFLEMNAIPSSEKEPRILIPF